MEAPTNADTDDGFDDDDGVDDADDDVAVTAADIVLLNEFFNARKRIILLTQWCAVTRLRKSLSSSIRRTLSDRHSKTLPPYYQIDHYRL